MIASAPGSARLFSATGTIRRSARDFQYELGLDRLFDPVAVMPPQTSSAWMGADTCAPSANHAARRCPACALSQWREKMGEPQPTVSVRTILEMALTVNPRLAITAIAATLCVGPT